MPAGLLTGASWPPLGGMSTFRFSSRRLTRKAARYAKSVTSSRGWRNDCWSKLWRMLRRTVIVSAGVFPAHNIGSIGGVGWRSASISGCVSSLFGCAGGGGCSASVLAVAVVWSNGGAGEAEGRCVGSGLGRCCMRLVKSWLWWMWYRLSADWSRVVEGVDEFALRSPRCACGE